jgi:hypothetical protein
MAQYFFSFARTAPRRAQVKTCHARHGGKQAHLKIRCAEAREKHGQERRGNIRNADANPVNLYVAEITLLNLQFFFV